MYSQAPPPMPKRPWIRRHRTALIVTTAAAVLVLAAAGWFGSRAALRVLEPSGDAALAQLRQVPHPSGAVEVGHRTERGTYHSQPSAWLTYRTTGTACPSALSTFLAAGAREQNTHATDPAAAYCKPTGKGFESFCLPTVCFFADFLSDHDPAEYTISTGPDGEG
jgi:hypothetical protein